MNTPISRIHKPDYTSWAEVDLGAIRHNFQQLKKIAGKGIKILSVVKADAYGHGMVPVARVLNQEKTDFFGVADTSEGITLRQNGIKKPILIFENALPSYVPEIIRYNLTATVCALSLAAALNRLAKKAGKKVKVHIKIDTGMGRLGVWHQDALEFVAAVNQLTNLTLEGIYTHFPVADTDRSFTLNQIKLFLGFVSQLKKCGVVVPFIHAANSAGLIDYPTKGFNLVRPGLSLYGMYPHPRLKLKIKLKPALSVKSRIMFIKKIRKGRSVSYGRTFISTAPMTIATIPVGYNDGYFRYLSNTSHVLVEGISCPVVGRVTMDQLMVDVSKVKLVKEGMEVALLGRQKNSAISAEGLAEMAHTINYEISCSLGNRLPRVYKI